MESFCMASRAASNSGTDDWPQTFATVPLARHWLSQAAAKRGFENFDIVVERLTDEDLVAEDDA